MYAFMFYALQPRACPPAEFIRRAHRPKLVENSAWPQVGNAIMHRKNDAIHLWRLSLNAGHFRT